MSKNRKTSRAVLAPSLVLASTLVFASAPAPLAAAEACPDGDTESVQVAIQVTIEPPSVSVDRDSVTIYRRAEGGEPKRVCWIVSGLSTTTRLKIVPKPADEVDPFPVMIRQLTTARTFSNSGNPTHEMTWRYGLRLVDGSGATLTELDPMVIVKGRPGD